MSATDDEVLAAGEELGEELRNAQQEQSRFEFDSLLMRCNDAIGREIGIDYGSACGAGDDCC
ncbi:MAG: halo-CC-star protein HcsS [Halohasta sp.]